MINWCIAQETVLGVVYYKREGLGEECTFILIYMEASIKIMKLFLTASRGTCKIWYIYHMLQFNILVIH